MTSFRAFYVDRDGDRYATTLKQVTERELSPGEVTIRVAYSSVNYKDGLAVRPDGKIVTSYPLIPGIDLSGTVERSEDPRFSKGMPVLVTGYGLGVSHDGGFSEYARVPAEWIVPLPDGLSLREAMIIGTAGFTAALSVERLRESGVMPGKGPIAVTGATGGVGSMAVALLSNLGYEVTAGTGKSDAAPFLKSLGAAFVLSREELAGDSRKALQKERWAGAIDSVGGAQLASLLSAVRYGGAVAASGLTGGTAVPATVFPFILRGVSLHGIDSVQCPHDVRIQIWNRLAEEWKPSGGYERLLAREVGLGGLREELERLMNGEARGRTIVNMSIL